MKSKENKLDAKTVFCVYLPIVVIGIKFGATLGSISSLKENITPTVNIFNKYCNNRYITQKHKAMCIDLANAINGTGTKKVEFTISETESAYDIYDAINTIKEHAMNEGF